MMQLNRGFFLSRTSLKTQPRPRKNRDQHQNEHADAQGPLRIFRQDGPSEVEKQNCGGPHDKWVDDAPDGCTQDTRS